MGALALVPIYMAERTALVDRLADELHDGLGTPIRVHPPWFDPETAFDGARGQYHSTRILRDLIGIPDGACTRVLGVTSVDLFIPVLTFVFGEAQLDGKAALVSMRRLCPDAYGLPRDEDLVARRLHKEAVHELGHTLGLRHCSHPTCVMRASTYVEEIDLKDGAFCPACARLCAGRPVA